MKTKAIAVQTLILCLIAIFVSGLSSCTSSSDDDSSITETSATISGTLTFTSTEIDARLSKVISSTSLDNYLLWVQNRASKRVHFVELDSNGSFSLPITLTDQSLGKNYILGLVQEEPLEFIGTIYKSSTEDASVAYTGFEIEGDVDDISIEFDLNNLHGLISNLEELASVNINEDLQTRIDGERPVGANNAGKGTESRTPDLNTANSIDQDEDGVPDIFDAMNNGQDYDNTDLDNSDESVVYSDSLISAIMFTNLKIDEEFESSYTVTDNAVIVIEVVPVSGANIASIVSDLRHSNFNDAVLHNLPDNYTDVNEEYPSENTPWSDENYTLYEATDSNGETRWTVLFKPENNDFESGNLVRLEVTLDSGDVEYYFVGFNFKFESIVDSTTTAWTDGAGEVNNPYDIPATGNLELTWDLPEDEDGNALSGLTMQLEIFYYDTDQAQIGSMEVYSISGEDATSVTLPSEYIDITPTPSYIQLDINARYPYGDNSSNKVYFRRDTWSEHVQEGEPSS